MNNFDKAFDFVVSVEGEFTDSPHDRGNWTTGKIGQGELKGTKYGVSAMSFPNEDIKNLTLDKAKEIYKEHYWNPVHCDSLDYAKSVCIFDCAVNQGVVRAKKFAQSAVGVVVDGIIGPKTMVAMESVSNEAFVESFLKVREEHYRSLSTFSRYGKGWLNRLEHVKKEALG